MRSIEMRIKFLFLIILISAFAATARAGLNVLENPSFEIGTWTSVDDIPDYWDEFEPSGGTANWYKDPEGAYEGDYYVGFSGGTWPYFSTGRTYPCTEGEIWYVGGYVKGTTTDEGNFQTIYDSDIDWINNTFYPPSETEWTYIETAVETPEGATKIGVQVAAIYSVGEVFFDSVWLAREPYSTGTATDPIPPDGGSAANDLEELKWTNPDQSSPSEIITCDVWFSYDFGEYGKYKNDPNFTNYAIQLVDNDAVEAASLLDLDPPLEMEHTYYWRVDVYDPNKIDEPGKYPVIGKVWIFDTVNQAPEVDSGLKVKAWLTEATVDVQIDATVTDDGMPLDPGIVTLQWTVDDGPATPVFSDDTVEDPVVTFDTIGRYTLRLTADDSLLNAYDTVIVDIYPGDYTGLVAHWKLDEESGPTAVDSVGSHDGTLMGDATWIPADGQVGGAIELDGDRDYIEIADSSGGGTWADLAEEVTVSCWIKVNEFTRGWQAVVCKGNTSYRMQRNDNNDSIWFSVSEAGVAGELSVNDGKWHYVAGTYDGETISLFIDGHPDVSIENSDGIDTNEAALTIGENLEYMAAFDGLIDEVRIYEIALPAEKVLAEFVSDDGSESCGQVYDSADINRDCRVDLLDFAEMAAGWLTCGDITEPSCLE
jgi:hypothetical protein